MAISSALRSRKTGELGIWWMWSESGASWRAFGAEPGRRRQRQSETSYCLNHVLFCSFFRSTVSGMRKTSTVKDKNPLPQTVKVVVWKENGSWLGYLQEYPDYWTQGKT